MNAQPDFSPVSLSYVGALRGIKPRKPGDTFTYAEANCLDPDAFLCLAASNPEGRFYGIVPNSALRAHAEKRARDRGVANAVFLGAALGEIVDGKEALPPLDYLCCDERAASLPAAEREALFALAEKFLLPGGLLCTSYRPYERNDGALHFLARELAPEMDEKQSLEFLHELKALGQLHFKTGTEALKKLDAAIAGQNPEHFFKDYKGTPASSRSFDTIVALRPRGFFYAGDAAIGMNYMELAAPSGTHKLIADCKDNPLYESIKDLAVNRSERTDIWCRQPALMSTDLAELFGGFTYGITMPRAQVPGRAETQGAPVDLSGPLYSKLADLLTMMPAGIGDILAYPATKDFAPSELIGALQILIACDIVRPMRGRYEIEGQADIAQPRLSSGFNQYLDQTMVMDAVLWLASPIAGRAIAVPPREALVMQALNRAGLADSVAALLPELQRLAQNPAAASRIMDAAEPTPELAHHMIEDVVTNSIVQWYAYGLLKAA